MMHCDKHKTFKFGLDAQLNSQVLVRYQTPQSLHNHVKITPGIKCCWYNGKVDSMCVVHAVYQVVTLQPVASVFLL